MLRADVGSRVTLVVGRIDDGRLAARAFTGCSIGVLTSARSDAYEDR
jgi:hypothetical protein